jgi:hypothetical protein
MSSNDDAHDPSVRCADTSPRERGEERGYRTNLLRSAFLASSPTFSRT